MRHSKVLDYYFPISGLSCLVSVCRHKCWELLYHTVTSCLLKVLKIWEAQKYFSEAVLKQMMEVIDNPMGDKNRPSDNQQFSNSAPPIPSTNNGSEHHLEF